MILRVILAEVLLLTLCRSVSGQEKCTTESDINDIKAVLANLKNNCIVNVAYSVNNVDSVCKLLLEQIKTGLTKLTHQRRMMSKRYVTKEQFEQLENSYDRQLREVLASLNSQKRYSGDSLQDDLDGALDDTKSLINMEKELCVQLRTWDDTNDRLRKELFDHLIAKGDIAGALKRFSQMKSDYYTEAIFHDLAWRHNQSVDVMTQLLDVIQDLDDRTEALTLVYENAKKYYRLNLDSDLTLLLVEAEVVKVKDRIGKGGLITSIQRRKLFNMSLELDVKTEQVVSRLMEYDVGKEAEVLSNLKKVFVRLEPSQMKKIAKVICLASYSQQRRFVNFLAILPSYSKIDALEVMVESGLKSLQFSIMWTLNEIGRISGVLSGNFNQSVVDRVMEKLEESVKSVVKCTDKLKITNHNGGCIQISETNKIVWRFKSRTIFHKVLLVDSSRCTTFKLNSFNDTNEFFSIVSHTGRRLVFTDGDFSKHAKYVGNEPNLGLVQANGIWLLEPSTDSFLRIRVNRHIAKIPIVHDLWTASKDSEEHVLIVWEHTLFGEGNDRLLWKLECVE